MAISIGDWIGVVGLALAALTYAAAYAEKLPFVQKRPKLLGLIEEADAIAGQLRLELPQGTPVAQLKMRAEAAAAGLAQKYVGANPALVALRIVGTVGSIVEDGHILPPSVAPVVDPLIAELNKLNAQMETLLAQKGDAPAPTPTTLALNTQAGVETVQPVQGRTVPQG